MMTVAPEPPLARLRAQPARRGRGAALARDARRRRCRARLELGEAELLIADPEQRRPRARARSPARCSCSAASASAVAARRAAHAARRRDRHGVDRSRRRGAAQLVQAGPGTRARPRDGVRLVGRARAAARDADHESPLGILRARRRRGRDADRRATPCTAACRCTTRRGCWSPPAARSSVARGSRSRVEFAPTTFWDEVRRYGVSVVFYAGEMCRALVDAPPVLGEKNNPVRLFAGRGMRRDVWRQLVDRFGPRRRARVLRVDRGEHRARERARQEDRLRRPPAAGQPRARGRRVDFADDELRARRRRPPGPRPARRARHAGRAARPRAASPTSRTSIPNRLLRDAFDRRRPVVRHRRLLRGRHRGRLLVRRSPRRHDPHRRLAR